VGVPEQVPRVEGPDGEDAALEVVLGAVELASGEEAGDGAAHAGLVDAQEAGDAALGGGDDARAGDALPAGAAEVAVAVAGPEPHEGEEALAHAPLRVLHRGQHLLIGHLVE
jgi:hypothetical protein